MALSSWRRSRAPARAPPVDAMRKSGIGHTASLVQFLIFCKRLPSEPTTHSGQPGDPKLSRRFPARSRRSPNWSVSPSRAVTIAKLSFLLGREPRSLLRHRFDRTVFYKDSPLINSPLKASNRSVVALRSWLIMPRTRSVSSALSTAKGTCSMVVLNSPKSIGVKLKCLLSECAKI